MKAKYVLTIFLWLYTLTAAEHEDGYTFIDCEIKLRAVPFKQEEAPTRFGDLFHYSHPYIPQKRGSSNNWCGYVAASNFARPIKNTVSAVYGTWVVPSVKSSGSPKTYSSIWVGIDGYGSNSVEQIGTAHEWRNGQQRNYAWFEMYPLASCEIVGFPINPGDTIFASVVYQGNDIFLMTITNMTKKVTTVVPTMYTMSKTAARVCAEWVAEAPYLNGILPLADFKQVNFSQCTATINGIRGPINHRNWAYESVNMQNALMVYKATTTPLGANGETFNVLWHHE
jgi:hypothetical protein